jgi:threonine/homoserine efflux transporter RhtA
VSPAVAALSGLAIRGQRLSLAQWLGIALVMVASAAAVAGAEPPDAVAPGS